MYNTVGQFVCLVRMVDVGLDDTKFVAAKPSHNVVSTNGVRQPFGNDTQDLVAGLMTKPIVDRLEAIEVQKQDRKSLRIGSRNGDSFLEALIEMASVGQAGQCVMEGAVRGIFFGFTKPGYVHQDIDNKWSFAPSLL